MSLHIIWLEMKDPLSCSCATQASRSLAYGTSLQHAGASSAYLKWSWRLEMLPRIRFDFNDIDNL